MTHRLIYTWLGATLVMAGLACQGATNAEDAGGEDAGSTDGSSTTTDGGSADADSTDTGSADADSADAGMVLDGSTSDANREDAASDAGTPSLDAGPAATEAPRIADMGLHEVAFGEVFRFTPSIAGDVVLCRKDLGHDDVRVDPATGAITWDTSGLRFGRGQYIRIVCSNYAGEDRASMIVHVDRSGTSRLRVAGRDGVSPYIGVAARSMNAGDTLVIPDGSYPVSVTRDESYENAFDRSRPTPGSATQLSTMIAASPGGVTISGAAHDGIRQAKKAFQLRDPRYTAIVGFVVRDVLRESFTSTGGDHLLVDFLGTAGAGTNGRSCTNFSEAANGWCSNAGFRINSAQDVLVQNGYDWADNRYGIMLRSTNRSVVRRSLVRLDAYLGDQPFGAHSHYCTQNDLLQDSLALDSLATAAPHYKHFAGIAAYPATGCESVPVNLATVGFLSLNNQLHLSTADSHAASTHRWERLVVWDTEAARTPQFGRESVAVIQGDQPFTLDHSTIGLARGFAGGDPRRLFAGEGTIRNSTLWNMPSGTLGATLESSNTFDVSGQPDQLNPTASLRYLPRPQPGSPLADRAANQLYYTGRLDTWYGDAGYESATTSRRWPLAGEDIIGARLASYDNPSAIAVGGGTVHVRGDRGAAAPGETLSEYIWAYLDERIPPLVVRVSREGTLKRIAWEHLRSFRRASVTGFRVWCMDAAPTPIADLPETQLLYRDASACSQYAVTARYGSEESGFAYIEVAE
ncbi:MAG: hypothetical protein GXP55_24465 [Deltaproteobacteria bacterium]|nr:hypothetical protein [Deltaproteobacteria bacterium]